MRDNLPLYEDDDCYDRIPLGWRVLGVALLLFVGCVSWIALWSLVRLILF